MMKIVEKGEHAVKNTTLNDIPVGEVFRGSIVMESGATRTGVFYKAHGPSYDRKTNYRQEVSVVQLDTSGLWTDSSGKKWANTWSYCREVRDYEPLQVELVIK